MSTIWKIANGFKVPFSRLTRLPENEVGVVDKKNIISIKSDDGLYECTPFFPFDARQSFEMFTVALGPGHKALGEPHPKGTVEYLIVFDGEVLVEHGEEIHRVKRDQAIKFTGDIPHSYYNDGKETARYVNMVYYAQNND